MKLNLETRLDVYYINNKKRKIEDTVGVIRIRKSKDRLIWLIKRQNDKQQSTKHYSKNPKYLQNTTQKPMIEQQEPNQKSGVNSGTPQR